MKTTAEIPFYNMNEPDRLELDSKHPGIHDTAYINRRNLFFETARKHRLENLGLPEISYTEEENAIWRLISKKLISAHQKHASKIYLSGKDLLQLETDHIPQLNRLDERLRQQHNMGLVPAEGLIDVRNFFQYLSHRLMPCTQFLRHGANPEYTPEPDAVHDVIGHIPPLMNKEYGDLIQLIGLGVKEATMEQLQAWQRMYWFTIEFGLIRENNTIKVLGAGLLSSYGEMEYCFSEHVERRPFVLEEVIQQEYDATQMNPILYIIPSLQDLYYDVKRLIQIHQKERSEYNEENIFY